MVLVDRAEKRSRNPRRDEKWMAGLPFSIRHNQSEADVYIYIYIYVFICTYMDRYRVIHLRVPTGKVQSERDGRR